VVRDLDKSIESISNVFGIGPWNVNIREANSLINMTYYGKPARFSFKVASTQNNLDGIEIELIQPISGDNIYSDFLREHGEGIHHLGSHKVDSSEAFDETTQALEGAGFPCMMSARTYRAAFGYFDTTKILNTILEVFWFDPSISPSGPV